MARVIISEYFAKKILIGDSYDGITIDADTNIDKLILSKDEFVVKVDDGTKKRNQKGLVELGLTGEQAKTKASEYLKKNYRRVLIEPMFKYQTKREQYISFTLVREGVSVLYSNQGGKDVESTDNNVERMLIKRSDFIKENFSDFGDMPASIMNLVLRSMCKNNLSFVEINPFVELEKNNVLLLDAAVEFDSSKMHTASNEMVNHIQRKSNLLAQEKAVAKLNDSSTASFALTVFNKNAEVFTLLSGGGASLVVLDSLVDSGLQEMIGNYGEYSGAPSREETKIYTNAVLSLLFASKSKYKVLVIAGAVANFTDVTTTFLGIVDSCREHLEEFKKQPILVKVRRGGPRQEEGLALLRTFFEESGIEAIISGPDTQLSEVARDVKGFLNKKYD